MARKNNKKASRESKPKAKAVELDDIEEVNGGGANIETGIVLTTTIALGAAIALIVIAKGIYPT